jgi:hypothetical protein
MNVALPHVVFIMTPVFPTRQSLFVAVRACPYLYLPVLALLPAILVRSSSSPSEFTASGMRGRTFETFLLSGPEKLCYRLG